MRKLVLAFFTLVFTTAAYAKPPVEVNKYKDQLESLGYKVQLTEKSLLAKHPKRLGIVMYQYDGGNQMFTFYKIKKAGRTHRFKLLEAVNEINLNNPAATVFVDKKEEKLIITYWFTGPYDRTTFGNILDQYDKTKKLIVRSAAMRDYLQ